MITLANSFLLLRPSQRIYARARNTETAAFFDTVKRRQILKNTLIVSKILSWLAALSGILYGIIVLAEFGVQEISPIENRYLLVAWFAVGLVAIIGSCVALWNQRFGGLLSLAAAPPILVLGLMNHHRGDMVRGALFGLVPLVLLGLFWRFASHSCWPQLVAGPLSLSRKITLYVLAFFSFTGLIPLGAAVITLLQTTAVLDCGRATSFGAQRHKGQAVFVATMHDPGIAVIKERFLGLPFGGTHFVLIAHWGIGHNELDGRTYFIDGRRERGLLTRFLPIIDVSNCGRSSPLDLAALDLRILRGSVPQNGVRIVGQVSDFHNKPQASAKVVVTGPMGSTITTTDSEGIFDAANLPPGHYAILVEGCDERENTAYHRCSDSQGSDLKTGDIWGVEFRTD